jgi:hypothetical protein
MKMTAFWDMVACSVALMMGALNTSETAVFFYKTTRRDVPEVCLLQ